MGESHELLIVGGGAAGLTAGIYAARNGLDAIIIEKGLCGGQASTSPWIENYPGFEGIGGLELMQRMRQHAEKHLPILEGAVIDSARVVDDGFILSSGERSFMVKALVLATGAVYRHLGVPGEEELAGRGVSYCATCDGMFFRGKAVAVVGGGNNAAVEAIHLKNVGVDVTVIHRRATLRAERSLQEQLVREGVRILFNTELKGIEGKDKVERLSLLNNQTGESQEMPIDGVFVSVGEIPNTALAEELGVQRSKDGYIKTDRAQRTSVPMIYAAGDVTGRLRQVVTACAEGAIAATSAFEDLRMPYWVG